MKMNEEAQKAETEQEQIKALHKINGVDQKRKQTPKNAGSSNPQLPQMLQKPMGKTTVVKPNNPHNVDLKGFEAFLSRTITPWNGYKPFMNNP